MMCHLNMMKSNEFSEHEEVATTWNEVVKKVKLSHTKVCNDVIIEQS